MRIPLFFLALVLMPGLTAGQPSTQVALEDEAFNDYYLNEANIPVVKGRILNLTSEEIKKFKIECSVVTPFEGLQTTKNFELDASGNFEIKLDYAFPYQQIWINAGDLFFTGIYANTDLKIELDAQVLKTQNDPSFNAPGVKFLSTDGPLNTYMNNHILYKRETQLEIDRILQNLRPKKLEYSAYILKYDSLYKLLHQIDSEYINQNPSGFSWIIRNERESAYFGNLCVANWGVNMPAELFQKVKSHKAYLTSNNGMLFYQYFSTYLQIPVMRSKPKDAVSQTLKKIKRLDSLFSPSKADFFKIKLSSKDPAEQKQILETLLPSLKTAWCKAILQREYVKATEKLASINMTLEGSKSIATLQPLGQPIAELSFGAKLYKIDSSNAESVLANLKNSFKDKALYIDFWATWCAPCIQEFPHSKNLHDEAKDLPVEFVYLCTSDGSNMEKWKSKVAEFKLAGTHIFVDKKIESKLLEMFSGNGFPTYVLINTKGEYKPGIGRPSTLDKAALSEWIK